jgi:Glycine-rich domain-containing protein-like
VANRRAVRGVAINPEGPSRDADAADDIHVLLRKQTFEHYLLPDTPNYLGSTPLCDWVLSSVDANTTWKELIPIFKSTITDLKFNKAFKDIKRRNILTVLRQYYCGIVYPHISLDLVAAALRQREFAKKITHEECSGLDHPTALSHTITRYNKFLLLLNKKHLFKKTHLVPTLDIDLAWHTHQLFPLPYDEWCLENLGKGVNHDDTLPSGDLEAGLRETSLAWLEEYKEAYTSEDLKHRYFSPGRIVAGVAMPVYGLYMLHKGHQLQKTQTGIPLFPHPHPLV